MPSTYAKMTGLMGSPDNLIRIDPKAIVIDEGANPRDQANLDLAPLKAQIAENGYRLDRPISVYKGEDQHFHLIDGLRRLSSVNALIAEGHEFPSIPAIVVPRMADPMERLLSAIAANDSKPLEPIEEARAYARFLDNGWSTTQICSRVGRSSTYVRSRLVLLDATPAVTEAFYNGEVTASEVVQIVKTAEREATPQAVQLEKVIATPKEDGRKTRYQESDDSKIAKAMASLEEKYGTDEVRTAVARYYGLERW